MGKGTMSSISKTLVAASSPRWWQEWRDAARALSGLQHRFAPEAYTLAELRAAVARRKGAAGGAQGAAARLQNQRYWAMAAIRRWAEDCDLHLLHELPLPSDAADWSDKDCEHFAKAIQQAAARAGLLRHGDKRTWRARKPSAHQGEGQTKLTAALLIHHGYDSGWFQTEEPIGVNALARLAGVSKSTASAFFRNTFGGYAGYRKACRDKTRLGLILQELNNERPLCRLLGDKAARVAAPEPADADSD